MAKVTGIGGIFFKCADTKQMKDWYATHLGFPITDYGTMFEGREMDDPDKTNYTLWSPFKQDTKDFEPSQKDYMINYRVDNIEALVVELKNAGVTVLDEITSYADYGKFVHILDPEGNKLELFEPAG